MNAACSLWKNKTNQKRPNNKTQPKPKLQPQKTKQKAKDRINIICIHLFFSLNAIICSILNLDESFRSSKDQCLQSSPPLLHMISVPDANRYLWHELCINVHTYICIHTCIQDYDLFIILRNSRWNKWNPVLEDMHLHWQSKNWCTLFMKPVLSKYVGFDDPIRVSATLICQVRHTPTYYFSEGVKSAPEKCTPSYYKYVSRHGQIKT